MRFYNQVIRISEKVEERKWKEENYKKNKLKTEKVFRAKSSWEF